MINWCRPHSHCHRGKSGVVSKSDRPTYYNHIRTTFNSVQFGSSSTLEVDESVCCLSVSLSVVSQSVSQSVCLSVVGLSVSNSLTPYTTDEASQKISQRWLETG